MKPRRCIFILSIRSCGSSLLQRKLVEQLHARVVDKTPHHENETLFWTKAASVLGLHQHRLEKSEVPLPSRRALSMLRTMVSENAGGQELGSIDERGIFDAWTAIVNHGPGDLIEKSPHHLCQPEVVKLMERYADGAAVAVRFIGLVRNPTDTLYSSWRRFGIVPEREEAHWIRAYEALWRLRERRPGQVTILRYEDLVSGSADMEQLVGEQLGPRSPIGEAIHGKSVGKWRGDRRFGYSPGPEALELARRYGYDDADMLNPLARPWLGTRLLRRAAHGVYFRLPDSIRPRLKTVIERL
jgi:hypothetical protein